MKGIADLKESEFAERVKVLRGELDRLQNNIGSNFEDRIANLEVM